jgi:starch synthase
LAGSDFYLSPSVYETCGLMPMNASSYGTIPIINLSGGLEDNFNEDNAIIIQDGNLKAALDDAVNLYKNKNSL